jgi:predicted phosphodiesterase
MKEKLSNNKIISLLKTLFSNPNSKQYILVLIAPILTVILVASAFFFPKNKQEEEQPSFQIDQLERTSEKSVEDNENSDDKESEEDKSTETEDASQNQADTGNGSNNGSEDTSDGEDQPQPDPDPEPDPDESPSAVVAFYGDSQSDTDAEDANHLATVNHILATGANPVFHAGDLMEDGTQASLDRFNNVTQTLRSSRTFYACLGNNDRKVGDPSTPSQLWFDNFTFPNNEQWYSVNYGNLHVVVLDSAFAAGSGSQLSWLSSDLQSSASQNRITVVMYHHPTFASTISSQLVNYGADFVVAGHYHAYSHSVSNNIHYFVVSGQPSIGYMIARIYENHVEITVYNLGNAVIDTIEFNER